MLIVGRLLRLTIALPVLAAAALFASAGTAHADACMPFTSNGTTVTLCVTDITPQGGSTIDPAPGTNRNSPPIPITGATAITAHVTWSNAPLSGETRGCYGERKTPSGCMSWMDATKAGNPQYILTQLFPSKTQTDRTYSWVWHTDQYQNGTKVLEAQIKLNNNVVSVDVPVAISNPDPGGFTSPIPNGGKLPTFTQSTPFVIAATGDGPAGSPTAQPQAAWVSNLVHSWNPQMFMYLGDVYQRGTKDEFVDHYDPFYGASDPAHYWDRTVPTIGNHEYKWDVNGDDYFWYWNYPMGSATISNGGGGWYSLNAGGWHIISLNSNVGMTLNPATPQGTWLQNDLTADKLARPLAGHPCTLAFWHHARFSDISLRLPATSTFWNQLYPYHADIIVNAHSHVYEHWGDMANSDMKADNPYPIPDGQRPKGITQFVVGTGGNVLANQWNTRDPNSDYSTNTSYGALKLVLYPDHAHFEYWNATSKLANDSILEQGNIYCH